MISKLVNKCSHQVEVEGFSGGIWVLWKGDMVVDILVNHRQFIHMHVMRGLEVSEYFTAIYGSPNRIIRCELWGELKCIADGIDDKWLLACRGF